MEYQFFSMPKPAGAYRLGSDGSYFQVNLQKKPIWLHRVMMRLCLGWEWVDL